LGKDELQTRKAAGLWVGPPNIPNSKGNVEGGKGRSSEGAGASGWSSLQMFAATRSTSYEKSSGKDLEKRGKKSKCAKRFVKVPPEER